MMNFPTNCRLLLTVALGASFAMGAWSPEWAAAQPPGFSPGGPPGMMGGPPPMMMGGGAWGGDRGGDRRGGPGGRGDFGGGGFDPSQFIARMDTNGNGSLDPEEVQGPARFMLERMARNNPKIDMSKPIPISVLTESIQQMRGGGSGGSPWGGPGGEGEDTVDIETGTLVPGFGIKRDLIPLPGFGASAERFAIKVDERDLREAEERLRRYDKNRDGALDEAELKEARWNDAPLQWDRNRDGKLSLQELAARYARRREQRQEQETRQRGGEDPRGRTAQNGTEEKAVASRPFEKIASFRLGDPSTGIARPAGLPEWFARDDVDGDNQVSMNEFARKWDASTLEDFYKFDANEDGYITAKECLAGVKKGFLKGSSSSAGSSATTASAADASSSEGATREPARVASSPSGNGKIDPAMLDWSKKRIARLDKDKNGFLTPDEFSDSSAKFSDVDKNGNGQIDVEEYAAFRQNRS